MFSNLTNAATAIRDFWLWRPLFTQKETHTIRKGHLMPLVFRFQDLLSELIHDLPMPSEAQLLNSLQIQQLAGQLQKGVIPSLYELAEAFPNGTETAEAKHLLIRYIYFLSQAGDAGRLRCEQLQLFVQLQSRKNMKSHLEAVHAKYQPNSPEAKEFRSCIGYVRTSIHEMEQALQPLLEQDPSGGNAIRLHQRYGWAVKLWRWLNRSLGIEPAYGY